MLTACRDRDRLPRVLLRCMSDLLGTDSTIGIFTREPQGEVALRMFYGLNIMNSALFLWPSLFSEVHSDGLLVQRVAESRKCSVCWWRASRTS